MKVIKRNGSEVDFDITKIIAAITKANDVVEESERMTPMQIRRIAESVDLACQKMNRSPSVEEIQDLVCFLHQEATSQSIMPATHASLSLA